MRPTFVRLILGAAAMAGLVVLASCGTQEPADTTATSSPKRVEVAGAIDFTPVFANLTFDQPLLLTWVPGPDDWLAVAEQAGRVYVFPNREDVTEPSLFLDITGRVRSGGEEGFLGLAFDPAYQSNGFFYIYYSAANPRRSVISRFTVSPGDAGRADPESEKIILEVIQPAAFSNHKAGMLAFGPDGKLYIGLGDGGGSGDPNGNGQNLGTLLGKILRIDVSGSDPYLVPGDNPFVGGDGTRGEIWAYGFRNPYRFSFDRESGDLWAGDVGETSREEVDLVIRGGDYGWNIFEGTKEFENPGGLREQDFQPPVIDYDRSQGRSVIGGYVYRGAQVPSQRGKYFYGDYYSGRIWALAYRDGNVLENSQVANVPGVSSFGEDRNGELYLVSHGNGRIYRLAELR